VNDDPPFAALLLRGVVTREVVLAGRCSASLFGPGDCFRPWRAIETALPCTTRWHTSGAEIAVLDERFVTAARRWPALAEAIDERLAEQLDLSVLRAAISSLPNVENRIIAAFWQLADRWGVVRPEGIVVRLSLTHTNVGHLVGAQRSTVSLALQALAEDGLLCRTERDLWVLSPRSRDALDADLAKTVVSGHHEWPRPDGAG
jgi:CRP-like cAMP-binding protein